MGMNLNKGSNTSGRFSGRSTLSEINVTPFVDVMLVLLIVFMVSAPLMQQGIEVNLPKADAGALAQSEDPLVISVDRSSSISFEGKKYSVRALADRLAILSEERASAQILVQADRAVSYGVVANVMAELKKAHFTRVGLVTEPE